MAAGPTFEPLATYTIPSAQSSYTFTSISGSYTDLVIIADYAGFSAVGATTALQFNGDTASSSYSSTTMYGQGTSALSGRYTRSSGVIGMLMGGADLGYTTGRATETFHIQNYSNTTSLKNAMSRFSQAENMAQLNAGTWNSTAAITSVTILTYGGKTINSGTTLTLYGIAAA